MTKRKPFQPDPALVAKYVAHPDSIEWNQACFLSTPYLGSYASALRDARGRYAYIANDAAVLGYPSIMDRAAQMAAVVLILEGRAEVAA